MKLLLNFSLLYLWYYFHLAELENSSKYFANFGFLLEPSDVSVSKDKPVLFNCSTKYNKSSDPVQISWTKDGSPLSTNSRRQILSNGSLLMESRFDEGIYQCFASLPNVGTIASQKAKLQFSYLDKFFADDLKDISVYLGDTAILSCRINGLPTPTITQWYKNDAELNVTSSNYVVHREDGLLEIGVVTFSDFGRFKCRASNGDKWKTSPDIILVQNTDIASYQGVAPHFLTKSGDRQVVEGSIVTLPCAANGLDRNTKRPQIQWLKEGVAIDIHSDERYSIEGKGSLRIDGVQEIDSGIYICRAYNLEDAIDAFYTLSILVPPRFKSQPSNILVTEAMDELLMCEVYAVPKANITWLKNGIVLKLDDHIQIDGGNLRILGALKSDEGMYQCVASNQIQTTHTSVQLVVTEGTQLLPSADLLPPQDLISTMISTHFVALSWKPIVEADAIFIIKWEEFVAGSKPRTMNVTSAEANVQYLKAGTSYKFEVRSVIGLHASVPSILVFQTQSEVHVPDAPMNFHCSMVTTPSTLKLVWSETSKTFANYIIPTGYKIFYYEVGTGSEESELKVDYGLQQYILTIKKLRMYAFRILAYNTNGDGPSSEEILCRTFSDVPSVIPQNFTVEPQSPNSLIARWEESLDEGSISGYFNGYRIQYKPSKDKTAPPFIAVADASQMVHTIHDLQPGTEYSLRIAAQSRNGTGPWSNWIQTYTHAHDLDESNVPGPPSSLDLRPMYNSILVIWTAPVEQDVVVRGYMIGYGVGLPDRFTQMVDAKQRYHTIKGLNTASEYIISLKAYNNAGEGMPLYQTTVTKDETVVDITVPIIPPVGLKTIVLSISAILVTWTDTTLGRNQRVSDGRYYTVRYTAKSQRKYKYINSTDLRCQVEELKADSEYEFAVRTVKGKRQSAFSLSVFNRTKEALPTSAPRDLTANSVDGRPKWVTLSWQPPRQSNGLITGYLVFYTSDASRKDDEWSMEVLSGDRLSATIKDLSVETIYYFKIRAKNMVGYGPMTATISFKTPRADGFGGGQLVGSDEKKEHNFFNNNEFGDVWLGMIMTHAPSSDNSLLPIPPNILWMSIGGVITVTIIALIAVIIVICVRRNAKNKKMDDKNCYLSKDTKSSTCGSSHVELKPPDLWIHGRNVGMRSEEADESTEMLSQHPSSFDEDCASDSERYRHGSNRFKLKPIDTISSRDPYVLNLLNGQVGSTTPTSSINRPIYPRTQYTSSQNPPSHHPASITPRVNAGHLNSLPHEELSVEKIKSLGVAPTFAAKNKQSRLSNLDNDPNADSKSFTTEELTAEMANLEGLMKDLSAITQNEFEC